MAPTRLTRVWVVELMEQKPRNAVTSANLHPSQEIPAESPWRLGESLDVSRPAGPGSSQAPAAAVGDGGSWLAPGVPGAVPTQDELQPPVLCPCELPGCWDPGRGAEGCALRFSSPSGCLQWEHWFCTHFLVQDPFPSLSSPGWLCFGQAPGDALGRWDAEPCCPPPPNSARAVREVGVRFLGLGSDPPHRAPTTSFSHLAWGWMCRVPFIIESLCREPRWAHPAGQNPRYRSGPLPWTPG